MTSNDDAEVRRKVAAAGGRWQVAAANRWQRLAAVGVAGGGSWRQAAITGSRSSSMVWAETDDQNDRWVYYSDPNLQQKQSLLSDDKTPNSCDENTNNGYGNNREVKIMLSKKKLEELLGKVEDLHNIPVDQILDRLIDSSDRFQFDDEHNHHHHHHHQQPWKPNLQSIPEEY
ncbi:hypothetical protein L6452_19597 [Arctium lappa]|uniref:Uncharacterized protein n=1 Tax=Arctium lappa TaxID=4217 RepID=A0ACB9B933_ARCLA|nr:hypothetical protein L6452_19597 [Arctium lappa]